MVAIGYLVAMVIAKQHLYFVGSFGIWADE